MMKLGQILPYIDKIASVVIWEVGVRTDIPLDAEDNTEKVFEGVVMDIPWVYMNYYLYNDVNGEAIDARMYDESHEKCGLVISICEKAPTEKDEVRYYG